MDSANFAAKHMCNAYDGVSTSFIGGIVIQRLSFVERVLFTVHSSTSAKQLKFARLNRHVCDTLIILQYILNLNGKGNPFYSPRKYDIISYF